MRRRGIDFESIASTLPGPANQKKNTPKVVQIGGNFFTKSGLEKEIPGTSAEVNSLLSKDTSKPIKTECPEVNSPEKVTGKETTSLNKRLLDRLGTPSKLPSAVSSVNSSSSKSFPPCKKLKLEQSPQKKHADISLASKSTDQSAVLSASSKDSSQTKNSTSKFSSAVSSASSSSSKSLPPCKKLKLEQSPQRKPTDVSSASKSTDKSAVLSASSKNTSQTKISIQTESRASKLSSVVPPLSSSSPECNQTKLEQSSQKKLTDVSPALKSTDKSALLSASSKNSSQTKRSLQTKSKASAVASNSKNVCATYSGYNFLDSSPTKNKDGSYKEIVVGTSGEKAPISKSSNSIHPEKAATSLSESATKGKSGFVQSEGINSLKDSSKPPLVYTQAINKFITKSYLEKRQALEKEVEKKETPVKKLTNLHAIETKKLEAQLVPGKKKPNPAIEEWSKILKKNFSNTLCPNLVKTSQASSVEAGKKVTIVDTVSVNNDTPAQSDKPNVSLSSDVNKCSGLQKNPLEQKVEKSRIGAKSSAQILNSRDKDHPVTSSLDNQNKIVMSTSKTLSDKAGSSGKSELPKKKSSIVSSDDNPDICKADIPSADEVTSTSASDKGPKTPENKETKLDKISEKIVVSTKKTGSLCETPAPLSGESTVDDLSMSGKIVTDLSSDLKNNSIEKDANALNLTENSKNKSTAVLKQIPTLVCSRQNAMRTPESISKPHNNYHNNVVVSQSQEPKDKLLTRVYGVFQTQSTHSAGSDNYVGPPLLMEQGTGAPFASINSNNIPTAVNNSSSTQSQTNQSLSTSQPSGPDSYPYQVSSQYPFQYGQSQGPYPPAQPSGQSQYPPTQTPALQAPLSSAQPVMNSQYPSGQQQDLRNQYPINHSYNFPAVPSQPPPTQQLQSIPFHPPMPPSHPSPQHTQYGLQSTFNQYNPATQPITAPHPPLHTPDSAPPPLPSLPTPDFAQPPLPPLPKPGSGPPPLPPLPTLDSALPPIPPLPTPDSAPPPLPPLPTPDSALPPLNPFPTPDYALPPLPKPDSILPPLPPMPTPDSAQPPLPPMPTPDSTLPPLPPMPKPDSASPPLPPMPTPDSAQPPLPPLPTPDPTPCHEFPLNGPELSKYSSIVSSVIPMPGVSEAKSQSDLPAVSDDQVSVLMKQTHSPLHKKVIGGGWGAHEQVDTDADDSDDDTTT